MFQLVLLFFFQDSLSQQAKLPDGEKGSAPDSGLGGAEAPDTTDLLFDWQMLINQLVEFLPNVLGALAIAIVGFIISRVVSRIIGRLLKRLRVDKLMDQLKEVDILSNSNIQFSPSAFLAKLVYYILLLIFLVAAVETLGMESVSNMISGLLAYLPNAFSAFAVFIVGLLIANFIKNIVYTAAKSIGIPSSKLIANFLFYFLFLNILMIALDQAGIKTEFLTSNLTLVLGGVVLAFAFGYGFASKDLMANYLASFYARNKFSIGDVINIDGEEGLILDKDSTSITMRTSNGNKVIYPLSMLTHRKVEIVKQEGPAEEFKPNL